MLYREAISTNTCTRHILKNLNAWTDNVVAVYCTKLRYVLTVYVIIRITQNLGNG